MEDEFGDMGPPGPRGGDRQRPLSRTDFEYMRQCHNPGNEPTGDCTGRCRNCGSKDLWTDNLAYGCNTCGSIFCGQ
jgi:hypothetical protein